MKQWDEFVALHPEGTFFHLSAWLKVISEVYSYSPCLYVMENSKNELSAIFPLLIIKKLFFRNRIVSLPFSDYGGPVITSDAVSFISAVLSELSAVGEKVEVRSSLPVDGNVAAHCCFKRHVLDLTCGIEELKKGIDKKTTLYNIRKADRLGVDVREETTLTGLYEFYRLNILTRRKHGVPVQPFAFFSKLYEKLIQEGLITIYLARQGEKVIGGGIFFKFKNGLYYKYNASDPAVLSTVSPNHAIIWHVIQRSYENGHSFIDFGRSSVDNKGLIRYKEMWGAKSMDLPYCYSDGMGTGMRKESGVAFRTLNALWRILPPAVTDRMGPLLYRYLG